MSRLIRDVMSSSVIRLDGSAAVSQAARIMQSSDVGAVLIEDTGVLFGILTDRDITVRVVAEGRDPEGTAVSEVCTQHLQVVAPDDDTDRALQLMRQRAVRRLPVVDPVGNAIGIVTLGDLALDRDSSSALGIISNAPPNH